MALICDIRVNVEAIGRIVAVRESGGIGGMCTYRVDVATTPHPLTGEWIDVKGLRIEHHYNEGPLELLQKAIVAAQEATA